MAEPLRYPLKAFTDKTDYLQITVVNYIPIGGCKVYDVKDPDTGAKTNGRACKQPDGSWKKTTYDYQKDN